MFAGSSAYDMVTPSADTITGAHDNQDICSETLRVEKKVFYLDLKSNSRGTFLKLSEKGANRERSTIAVPGAGVAWFRELFGFYASALASGGALLSKELPLETKVFQFDVGRNARGTFLRVSETGPKGRTAVVVPDGLAEGPVETNAWERVRNALAKISDHVVHPQNVTLASVSGARTVVGPAPSPPALTSTPGGGSVLRVGHKRFYFDLGSNQRGTFLRITEMVGMERLSIVVPFHAIQQFKEAVLAQCDRSQSYQGSPLPPALPVMGAVPQLPPQLPLQGAEGLTDQFRSMQLQQL